MSNIEALKHCIENNDVTLDSFDDRRNHEFTIISNQLAIMRALVELLESKPPIQLPRIQS